MPGSKKGRRKSAAPKDQWTCQPALTLPLPQRERGPTALAYQKRSQALQMSTWRPKDVMNWSMVSFSSPSPGLLSQLLPS